MVRPSLPDPVEVRDRLWRGFRGRTGWDVGANCGQTILEMAFDFDRILAFEPCVPSYCEARKLVNLHGLHAEVFNVALSDHDGKLELAYPAQEQLETGQLVTPGLKGMEWEPADWDAVERVPVTCLMADTMADIHGFPDFIKVDTEGHEVSVLLGAAGIIARRCTDFLVEFHSPENHKACEQAMSHAGYSVEVVRHPHYREDSPMWHQHGWVRAFAPRKAI